MKGKGTEASRKICHEAAALIGDIVGSSSLGSCIVESLIQPGEKPTERNIQRRIREAIQAGDIKIDGLGRRRISRLQSTLALSRLLHIDIPNASAVADEPAVAAKAFNIISDESVEKFAVLVLDVCHRIVSTRVISSGTATETCVHPREVLGTVLRAGGVRCIVAHNHPSGNLQPSSEDLSTTRHLIDAGKVMDIPVLDHLIVSGKSYQSLRQTTSLWAGTQP